MRSSLVLVALMLTACPDRPVAGSGGDTGSPGPLVCPGLQCECPCERPLFCEPRINACTATCRGDEQCGRLSGEHCIAGLCGVSCAEVGLGGDCEAVGMVGAVCMLVEGVKVCGYPSPGR